jgi:ADP-ribosylglycohydrolase
VTARIEDRIAGAVWGHLVGDALGVPYEFSDPGTVFEVRWGATGAPWQPPGTWSDDGGLMLAMLDSLLEVGFDIEDQGKRALAWYETATYKPGPVFDIGVTTHDALTRLKSGVPASEAGGKDEWDNGNGSLMRILPIALVPPSLLPSLVPSLAMGELVKQAAAASCLTHAHPRAQVTCAVYCAAARRLLAGASDLDVVLSAAIDDARSVGGPQHAAELENLTKFQPRTGGGYVLDCFWSAWSAFASSKSYRETVEKAIRLGNDTDTTASVAGGLAGLHWGLESIPIVWRIGMRGQGIAQPLIDRLVERWEKC